jgi:hypothetical protein
MEHNFSNLNYIILFDIVINKISTFDTKPQKLKSEHVKINFFLNTDRFDYIKKHHFKYAEIINSTSDKISTILCILEANVLENMEKINLNIHNIFAMNNSQHPKITKYIDTFTKSKFKNNMENYISNIYNTRKKKDLIELLSIISCKHVLNTTKKYVNQHNIINILATNILKIIVDNNYKFDNNEIIYLSIEEPMNAIFKGRFDVFGILKTPDCYYKDDYVYMPFVIEIDGNEHTQISNSKIINDSIKDIYCWLYGISILRIHKLEQNSKSILSRFFNSMSVLNKCTITFYEKYSEFRYNCLEQIKKNINKDMLTKKVNDVLSNLKPKKQEINITLEDIDKYSNHVKKQK